ncbi:MAG: hypothetical protein IJ094_12870 [Bacilli bacterium]|nr:hypothetical protein [Bacilli bacterium]
MNNLYYTVELCLIAAVPILNSINIKVPYWTICLIIVTHFIQLSFNQGQLSAQAGKLEELYKLIDKTRKQQKDIISKQKDLRDNIMYGGYN